MQKHHSLTRKFCSNIIASSTVSHRSNASAFANAFQELRRKRTPLYKPFRLSHESPLQSNLSPASMVLSIRSSIQEGEWEQARSKSRELANLALEGLRYLDGFVCRFSALVPCSLPNRYHSNLIRAIVWSGYMGWIGLAIVKACEGETFKQYKGSLVYATLVGDISLSIASASLLALAFAIIALHGAPGMVYVYAILSLYLWRQLANMLLFHDKPLLRGVLPQRRTIIPLMTILVGLQLMTVSPFVRENSICCYVIPT